MIEIKPPKKVSIIEVLKDLKSGFSRWKKDNKGYGSIEEKYNLNFTEMKTLVAHEGLKGIRTQIPSLIIVDDRDPSNIKESSVSSDDIEEESSIEPPFSLTGGSIKGDLFMPKEIAKPFL